MSYKRVNHFQFVAWMVANDFASVRMSIKRIVSARLFAIAVVLLTLMVCSFGVRAELKATPFSIRTHAIRPNLDWSPSPEMRTNSVSIN
jgi:hypothetical protein